MNPNPFPLGNSVKKFVGLPPHDVAPSGILKEPSLSRRDFLRMGTAAAGASIIPEAFAEKRLDDKDMAELDALVENSLNEKEGYEVERYFYDTVNDRKIVNRDKFNDYVTFVKRRAENSKDKQGVHFQNHMNAQVVVEVYEKMYSRAENKILLDPGLIYYPKESSAFVAAAKKVKEAKMEIANWESPKGNITSSLVLLKGETVEYIKENKLVAAVINVGLGYVILPKGMPIINSKNKKGESLSLIGPCRNPISAFYNTCPPCPSPTLKTNKE